jgi:hypothetical protein
MAAMSTYAVTTYREEGFWMVEIPELDLLTQARRLTEVERMARSIISLAQEVDRDSFDVAVSIRLPDDVRSEIDRTRRLRDQADEANQEAAVSARSAARKLYDTGMPLRDVGTVLDVSYQRAHQLVHS